MRKNLLALLLMMATLQLSAQSFYVCSEGNVETASELSFSDNGTTLNGRLSTSAIDSITMQVPDLRFVGGDISMLSEYEKQSARYKDTTGTRITNLIAFLKEQGWNTMRVRLFVDPSQDDDKAVIQDLEYVKALGRRIKDAGLLLVLDFHYSDTWADPAKQWTPVSWQGLTNDQLYTKIYDYTKDCLQQMNAAGASPDFIQTGNEISYGMLWGAEGSTGNRCYSSSENNWQRFANLLKQAGKACREECPRAKIILHTERVPKPGVLTNFYNQMKTKQVDYDIIGLSYYPYFHGNIATLETAITQLESTFKNKRIQVVEFGYTYKDEVPGTTYDYTSTYPYTYEGQRWFTADLITMLKRHASVDGLYWWYPEANAFRCTGNLKNGWYNATLFDNSSGTALPALFELKNFK
jgi:arabinogalactan endo-1,4-beta-galactosidase